MKLCLKCGAEFANADVPCPTCGYAPEKSGGIELFAPELALSNDGFGPEDYKTIAELSAGHFWHMQRDSLIESLFETHFPAARSFCEIGTSIGNVIMRLRSRFPEVRFYASDIYLTPLKIASETNPGCAFFQADILNFPFKEEFDVIGAFDVLEHIDDDQKALDSIFRALTPGGGAIVSAPQHMFLWSERDSSFFHKRRYSREDLVAKAERSGFKVERATSFLFLLMPLLLLSRKLKSSSPASGNGNGKMEYESRLPKALNYLLNAICSLETAAGRHGVNFPFGGSIVCVLRKAKEEA